MKICNKKNTGKSLLLSAFFALSFLNISITHADSNAEGASTTGSGTIGVCEEFDSNNHSVKRQCFLTYYFFGASTPPKDAYPTAAQIKLLDQVFQHPSWVAALGTNLNIFLNEENKDDPNLQPVFAAPASLRTALNRTSAQLDNNISKERDLKTAIIAWSNFLLPLAAVLAVVALVWAGFLYITATEDESQIDQAKKIIWVTTIGIVLIIGSYAIVNTLLQAVQ